MKLTTKHNLDDILYYPIENNGVVNLERVIVHYIRIEVAFYHPKTFDWEIKYGIVNYEMYKYYFSSCGEDFPEVTWVKENDLYTEKEIGNKAVLSKIKDKIINELTRKFDYTKKEFESNVRSINTLDFRHLEAK